MWARHNPINVMRCAIWYHLYNLNNVKKHPWRSVNFRGVSTLLKLTLFHGCFSRFLNRRNGTKSRNASQIRSFLDACLIYLAYHQTSVLTCFRPNPLKILLNLSLLMFLGGIEREHLLCMG